MPSAQPTSPSTMMVPMPIPPRPPGMRIPPPPDGSSRRSSIFSLRRNSSHRIVCPRSGNAAPVPLEERACRAPRHRQANLIPSNSDLLIWINSTVVERPRMGGHMGTAPAASDGHSDQIASYPLRDIENRLKLEEIAMADKNNFTPDEWTLLLESPM